MSHRPAAAGAALLALLAAASIAAPILSPHSLDIALADAYAPPSARHWLGTNELGKDLLTLLLHGGRVSLAIGVIAAIIATAAGSLIGAVSGYAGGRVDALLMRFTDMLLSLPVIALLVFLSSLDLNALLGLDRFAAWLDPGVAKLIVVISMFSWMGVARVVRSEVLSVRERGYVRAARAMGAGPAFVIARHVLPNCLSPIIVAATLQTGSVIMAEAVLSYLGLGVQPPTPSWGNILFRAQEFIVLGKAWWLVVWPGVFILVTVLSFNFVGDGLRDALDPKSSQRRAA